MAVFPLLSDCIPPLPSCFSLKRQVIVLTGAARGIGKEVAKQCVSYSPYRVILGVRSVRAGCALREELIRSICASESANTHKQYPLIHVLELDLTRIESVFRFTEKVSQLTGHLDVLLLNAATNDSTARRPGPLGFDMVTGVNCISNAILCLRLLPLLHARPGDAASQSRPSKITWVLSRALRDYNTFKMGPTGLTLLEGHAAGARSVLSSYANSKLLAAMFARELSSRLAFLEQSKNHRRIVVNSLCPGHVNTGLQASLPFYFRVPSTLIWHINGRTVESAGRWLMHAMFVYGEETDAQYLENGRITRLPDIVYEPQGQALQKQLWEGIISLLRQVEGVSYSG